MEDFNGGGRIKIWLKIFNDWKNLMGMEKLIFNWKYLINIKIQWEWKKINGDGKIKSLWKMFNE